MTGTWRGICFGLLLAAAAIALFFSPWGQKIEEDLGLALLFQLRGPRPAPDGALIVNLDHDASSQLGLPENFSTWPRSVHARVVDRLRECGAGAITFDVHFVEERKAEDDLAFATAVRRAGNVILFEDLRRLPRTLPDAGLKPGDVAVDTLVPPHPLFADAALALAPFPIPKRPVRINQTWLFKQSAGEVPTMPAVALAAMARPAAPGLQTILRRHLPAPAFQPSSADTELSAEIISARELFRRHPELAERVMDDIAAATAAAMPPPERSLLQALVRLYAGGDSIHINYYGPPATIPTLSYDDILAADESGLARLRGRIGGRAVFIGAARTTWSGQKDGFYTVFSQPDGLDLSGVEIAATVYGNLIDNTAVRRLSPLACTLLLTAAGIAAALFCTLCPPVIAGGILLLLSACAVAAAGFAFDRHCLWPPLVIPLSLQLPLAFVVATIHHSVRASRERGNIRRALELYLPGSAVDELTRDLSFIRNGDRMVYGACLLTDAQRYTALSESVTPEELSRVMKEYYQHLFQPVTDWGGQVCNIIGDSMLAIWPSAGQEVQPREKACQAALQLLTAIDRFNRLNPENALPTRIGLHYGYLLMGNIGAGSHFEYAPIGDIVNTASRIEGLNKLLGTRALASEAAIAGVYGVASRLLGRFLFAGKTQPITIYQLLTTDEVAASERHALDELFAKALAEFQSQRWEEAAAGFERCLTRHDDDGPSRFYLKLCYTYRDQPPPADWEGVIAVGK